MLIYRQIFLQLGHLTEISTLFSTLLSYWGLLDLIFFVHLRVCVVALCTSRVFLLHLPAPPLFDVGVEPLQDVNGVIDKQGQPGQAEEDPWGHEEAVPLRVYFVWITICKGKTQLIQSVVCW